MLKRTAAALIALWGLNSAAMAETAAALAKAAPTPTAPACTPPKIVDTIALNQVSGTDLMTAPVKINGKTRHFLLDIGTKPSSVSQATVAGLSLLQNPFVNNAPTAIQAGGALGGWSFINVPIYEVLSGIGKNVLQKHAYLGSFTIGNTTAHRTILRISNNEDLGRSEPFDGLLTGDFFHKYDVELDFAGKKMEYLTPTNCTDPNKVVFWPHSKVAVIPVTLAGDGRFQAQASVKGHIIKVEFDTSAARTVMRHDIADRFVDLTADTAAMTLVSGLKDGDGMQVYVHTFPAIFFPGGITAYNVPTLILTNSMTHDEPTHTMFRIPQRLRPADLAIGMDVLQHLRMYFVLNEGKIYATAVEPKTDSKAAKF